MRMDEFVSGSRKRYVCETCGFSEEWIDLHDIPKLKKKYDEYER